MLKAIFTLDYEIHGNGTGNPLALMVEPTERLLQLFDQYGAKLTIMADIGELFKFKQYFEDKGRDDYHYEAITKQLCDAVRRGHDVQLHIHSSYFNANHDKGYWVQDWSEYDFARLKYERMEEMVRQGKQFLETLLQPVDSNYKCTVFRAANWSVSPSQNVIKALLDNGIEIDTSVFKYGRREGRVNFDYSQSFHQLAPWRVDENDMCKQNNAGKLWEFPIYTEKRWIGAFLTLQRIYRAYLSRVHKFEASSIESNSSESTLPRKSFLERLLNRMTLMHAWKADFNQCSGMQLINALERAYTNYAQEGTTLPFVLIGHSKLYSNLNEWSLRPFLAHIEKNRERFGFAKFNEFRLEKS
jgi:hypothetical protein